MLVRFCPSHHAVGPCTVRLKIFLLPVPAVLCIVHDFAQFFYIVGTFQLYFMQNLHNLLIFLDCLRIILANFGAFLHNFKLSKKKVAQLKFMFCIKPRGQSYTHINKNAQLYKEPKNSK